MDKARTPIWKAYLPISIMAAPLLIFMYATRYDRSTVLLTASFGISILAFVGGFMGAAVFLWFARLELPRKLGDSDLAELKIGCGVFFILVLWGVACASMSDALQEARAFSGTQAPVTEASYPITATDDGVPRRGHLFGLLQDKPTITISSEDRWVSGVIPVPAELVLQAGNVRKDSLLDQKCLTLHIQQSGAMIRAVVRGPDGEMLEMRVHDCTPGPPPRATAPF